MYYFCELAKGLFFTNSEKISKEITHLHNYTMFYIKMQQEGRSFELQNCNKKDCPQKLQNCNKKDCPSFCNLTTINKKHKIRKTFI